MAARYSNSSDDSDGQVFEFDCSDVRYNSDGEAEIVINRPKLFQSQSDARNQNNSRRASANSNRGGTRSRNVSGQSNNPEPGGRRSNRRGHRGNHISNSSRLSSNDRRQKNPPNKQPNFTSSGPQPPLLMESLFPTPLMNVNNASNNFQGNNPFSNMNWGCPLGDRGGISTNRGGQHGDRGGINTNRGGQHGDRGGINTNRGGHRGDRGGISTNRGGHRGDRGSISTNRGSHRGDRGGISTNRGGHRGDRGGISTNRGGHRGDRGGISTNRGGHRGNRGDIRTNNRTGSTSENTGRGRGSRKSSLSSNHSGISSAASNANFGFKQVEDQVNPVGDNLDFMPSPPQLITVECRNDILDIEVSGDVDTHYLETIKEVLDYSIHWISVVRSYDNVSNLTHFHLTFVDKKKAFKARQIINSKKIRDRQVSEKLSSSDGASANSSPPCLPPHIRPVSESSNRSASEVKPKNAPIMKDLYLIYEGKIAFERFTACFSGLKGMQSYVCKYDEQLNITIVTIKISGKKTTKVAKETLMKENQEHHKFGRLLNCANGLVQYNYIIQNLETKSRSLEPDETSDVPPVSMSESESRHRVFIRVDGVIPHDFHDYLRNRTEDAIRFEYLKEENEFFSEANRSIAVLSFDSKVKAVRGMRLFHEGNRTCATKLLCRLLRNEIELDDEQFKIMEKIDRVCNRHKKEIQKRIDDHVAEHSTKIDQIKVELEDITARIKSRKNFSLDEFTYLNDQKNALEAKSNELDNQKVEFQKYTENMLQKIGSLPKDADFEKKVLHIRSHFGVECRRFTTALPMYSKREHILKQVKDNPVSIVIGETGSGKSTQMVQYLHEKREFLFSSAEDGGSIDKPIVCTQPRKIAAMTVAKRVSDEMNSSLGEIVGFQSTIHCKRPEKNKIVFMTDYVLLHECAKDPHLNAFSCVIIDEAHERSVYTDLLIAMLKRSLMTSNRSDFRVVITSATIDPAVFVKFFQPLICPVLHVSGRAFPVEIEWNDMEDEIDFKDQTRKAVSKAIEVHNEHKDDIGAILVFVTTPHDAEDCCDQFKNLCKGRNDCFCLPLHGKLQAQDQQKVFAPCPPGQRKVVFATNAAETSVTIPEVKYVIDTGLVKEMEYDAVRNMNTLNVNLVTQSSANQRKGRAGRTGPGKCYRLYSLTTYQNMEANSKPEILRIHLGLALIKLLVLRIDPDHFDFVDSPPQHMLDSAFDSLSDLGAINDERQITILGEWLGKLPFDPYIGAIVYHGEQEGIGLISLILSALASAPGSVFYSGGNDNEQRKEANNKRLKFCDEDGDLFSYFKAYRAWHKTPPKNKKAFSMENSLNNKVLSQVQETVKEIMSTLKKEMNVTITFLPNDPLEIDEHKSRIKSFLLRIFRRKLCHYLGHRKAGYLSIHQDQVIHLFPTCSLRSLGLDEDWLIYAYAMQTSCRFGLNVTALSEDEVVEAIENGTIDLDIEEVKRRRMRECCLVSLGKISFNEFVGPRFSLLRKLETDFQSLHPNCTVVLEADRDQGTLRFLCNSSDPTIENSISTSVLDKANSIKQKLLSEQEEQEVAGAFRIIIGKGASVSHILTCDEFCTVTIHASEAKHLSQITRDLVEETFKVNGKIVNIKCTHKSKQKTSTFWGFLTYSLPNEAKMAVDNKPESEILVAKRIRPFQQNKLPHNFRAKFSWDRRTSKGFAIVTFSEVENAGAALVNRIIIKGKQASAKPSKFQVPGEIFLTNLNLSADEQDVKEGISSALHLNPQEAFERVSVLRHPATDGEDLKGLKTRVAALVKLSIGNEEFEINMHKPGPNTAKYVAYVTFQNPEDGVKACQELNLGQTVNNRIIETKPVLSASIFVNKRVYSATKETLDSLIDRVNDDERNRGTADLKTLRSGNFAIDFNVADDVEYFLQIKSSIDEVVNGYRLTCQMDPQLRHVFSNQGRKLLTNLEETSKTCILVDGRTLSLTIHGTIDNRMLVINALRVYQEEMANSIIKRQKLSGDGLPKGIAKTLMERFGADCSKLAEDFNLISCEVDLKRQILLLTGNEEAINAASVEVISIIETLREIQNLPETGDNNPDCSVCFCPVDDELYRLEGCGHAYHLSCLKLHVENATKTREFPLQCTSTKCEEVSTLCDIKQIAQRGTANTMDEIIQSSVSCFVKNHSKDYHYCNSPDCDVVYRVSDNGQKFQCPICKLVQCTTCHVQFHYGISCEQWKSQDKDIGVEQWIRENPANRKRCPQCKAPIEKDGGCNHMTCRICKRHICWLCLQHFSTTNECYNHLTNRHGGVFNMGDLLGNPIPDDPDPAGRPIMGPARVLNERDPLRQVRPRPPSPPRLRPILRNVVHNNPPAVPPRIHHYEQVHRPPVNHHHNRGETNNGCFIL